MVMLTAGRSSARHAMIPKSAPMTRILVVEDVQETRDAIEALLKRDGYWVDLARDEHDTVETIRLNSPDVILISLGGTTEHVLSTARGIRERSGLLESDVTGVHTSADVSGCKVADGEKVQSLNKAIHQLKPDANAKQAPKGCGATGQGRSKRNWPVVPELKKSPPEPQGDTHRSRICRNLR
jgi:chemotaxis response regulator CheB